VSHSIGSPSDRHLILILLLWESANKSRRTIIVIHQLLIYEIDRIA
jgi:hypothetical protein